MILTNKSNLPIGVDISDLSIKLVQLNKTREKIDLLALGKAKIPAGMIVNGEIINFEGTIELLKKIINKPAFGSFGGNEVVACLPETKTYLKLIKVEHSPNKLPEIIGAEIEKNIPISINDIYYDWQTITTDNSYSYVLVGAAPRNLVNSYIKLINMAKLQVSALEIEAAAISRALLAEESPKFHSDHSRNYALIDIGAKRTSMIIYAQNSLVMTVSMPISGEAITKKIADTLEIKTDQAEKAKIICGLDKSKAQGIISDILSEMIDTLTQKILATLDYYNSQYSELGAVSDIIVCGGGSNVNDLAKIIKDKTGLETISGNILTNVNFDEGKLTKIFTEKHNINLKIFKSKHNKTVSIKQNTSLTYTTAIGLGLRNAFIPKF